MLVGRQRLAGQTPAEILKHRIEDAPVSLRTIDPGIPQAVDALILKCLEPDREQRFQTTGELWTVLDGLDANGVPLPPVRRLTARLVAAVVTLVVALLVSTYVVTRRAVEPPKAHAPVSVVIADFDNRTNDPALNQTIEPTLKRALEGASFITAFD